MSVSPRFSRHKLAKDVHDWHMRDDAYFDRILKQLPGTRRWVLGKRVHMVLKKKERVSVSKIIEWRYCVPVQPSKGSFKVAGTVRSFLITVLDSPPSRPNCHRL